jgi:hypothetical protein
VSVLELLVDDGLSRQRIAGPLRVDVPLDEFTAALDSGPELFEPLVATELSARRIELESGASPPSRAPKLTAFSSGLMPAVAGRGTSADKPAAPARAKPPKPPPRRRSSIGSFEKPTATLVFDDDESGGDKPPRS